MGIRFSLKWLLAAMVYGAIAAAAMAQGGWAFASLLTATSFFAFAYAILLACYLRGERQARALGFVIVCFCLAACLYFVPEQVPTRQLASTFWSAPTPVLAYPQKLPATTGMPTPIPPPSSSWTAAGPTRSYYVQVDSFLNAPDFPASKLHAVNAIACLLGGLLGAILGALAYRRARSTPGPRAVQ